MSDDQAPPDGALRVVLCPGCDGPIETDTPLSCVVAHLVCPAEPTLPGSDS